MVPFHNTGKGKVKGGGRGKEKGWHQPGFSECLFPLVTDQSGKARYLDIVSFNEDASENPQQPLTPAPKEHSGKAAKP